MPGEDVEYDTSGMHVVRQCFCTCRFDGLQAIGQNGSEDVDHLTVAAGQTFELFAHAPYGKGQ